MDEREWMSSEQYESLRAQARVQMMQNLVKPKPLTVEELRDAIEGLRLETAELRDDTRRDIMRVFLILLVLTVSVLLIWYQLF